MTILKSTLRKQYSGHYFPDAYKAGLTKNVLHVTFQGGAKPSDIKTRKVELECVMKDIESKRDRYVEFVDLPDIK